MLISSQDWADCFLSHNHHHETMANYILNNKYLIQSRIKFVIIFQLTLWKLQCKVILSFCATFLVIFFCAMPFSSSLEYHYYFLMSAGIWECLNEVCNILKIKNNIGCCWRLCNTIMCHSDNNNLNTNTQSFAGICLSTIKPYCLKLLWYWYTLRYMIRVLLWGI